MFYIELKKDILLGHYDSEDESVSEAVFSIYPDYENYEFIIHLNNDLKLLLDFRGDMSEIYNDVIKMMRAINHGDGMIKINFLSSSFSAIWHIEIKSDDIKIIPQWTTANLEFKGKKVTPDKYHKFESPIIITKALLLSEWNKLLEEIKNDLLKVGYPHNLKGFDYLMNL
ncbi:hypothetical protein AAG747_05625 [Rapidithrix thailandica]|uniref:Uncharacterized protein n=1 Tax=Rapidithrix thailandica TaxID=413964 RepID=A0AAW9RWD4_9BACT